MGRFISEVAVISQVFKISAFRHGFTLCDDGRGSDLRVWVVGDPQALGLQQAAVYGERSPFAGAEMADNFVYIRKQATQLYSKNRFIAAQFEAYLKDNLYLQMAAHSNQMAKYLEERLMSSSAMKNGVYFTQSVDTNGVYVSLSPLTDKQLETLRNKYIFYIWREEIREVRLMCSFKTTKEDIDSFITDLESCFK